MLRKILFGVGMSYLARRFMRGRGTSGAALAPRRSGWGRRSW